MRLIATDTNDFPRLRSEGCIYVDKTEFVGSSSDVEGEIVHKSQM